MYILELLPQGLQLCKCLLMMYHIAESTAVVHTKKSSISDFLFTALFHCEFFVFCRPTVQKTCLSVSNTAIFINPKYEVRRHWQYVSINQVQEPPDSALSTSTTLREREALQWHGSPTASGSGNKILTTTPMRFKFHINHSCRPKKDFVWKVQFSYRTNKSRERPVLWSHYYSVVRQIVITPRSGLKYRAKQTVPSPWQTHVHTITDNVRKMDKCIVMVETCGG